jgi:hypothetical protein
MVTIWYQGILGGKRITVPSIVPFIWIAHPWPPVVQKKMKKIILEFFCESIITFFVLVTRQQTLDIDFSLLPSVEAPRHLVREAFH